MASASRDEQDFCEGMETMFGQKIPFDSDVKYVIDEGIKESRRMNPEKRAQVIETAGYLVYDIMVVESLGDHADAEVAKGAKQAAESCIKKRLKEMKYPTVEETVHKPLSQKEAFDQEAFGYAKLLSEAMEAAEKYKGYNNDEGKPSANEEPLQMLPKETSRQGACESNPSVKEGGVVEMRKESKTRKRRQNENEEREGQRYRYVVNPFAPEISSVILLKILTMLVWRIWYWIIL